MKGLRFFEKIVFIVNTLAALLLLLSYGLSFLPPKQFGLLAVLSLGVPILIVLNGLFALYWILKFKKQALLSLLVLLLGFNYISSFYQFSNEESLEKMEAFTVMSYNVRLFNFFGWIEDDNLEDKIRQFIIEEQPDILAIQEYHKSANFQLTGYYKYESLSGERVKSGQAIYSKFPIINSGEIQFPNTNNDAIFVDVVVHSDTLRVYNLHLQSSKINTSVASLKKQSSQNLFKRLSHTFQVQQSQAELLLNHVNASPYSSLIVGDFNNTPYSYVYNMINDDFNDAFEVAGEGFGSTYDFKFFPFRIDFIMAKEAIEVLDFKTYDLKYSDHYPVKARLHLHH
jgi:endonuclease/exonuclease/phosphatase family metal-dependent hydrolase